MIDSLEKLRSLLKKSTPGPWHDQTQRFLERHARQTANGKWVGRPGDSVRNTWVKLITGKFRGGIVEEHADEWDYPHVLGLRWSSIKGDGLVNFMSEDDVELIIAVRNALPSLLDVAEAAERILDEEFACDADWIHLSDALRQLKSVKICAEPDVGARKKEA